MSYILDALKRSEQQRQRGAAPSLLAAQATEVDPRRPRSLFYGLAAATLLVVGVAIGMLRPWQTEAPAERPIEVKAPAAVVPPAPPAPAPIEITINTERQTTVPASATPPTPASHPVPATQSARATQPAPPTQPVSGPDGGVVKAQAQAQAQAQASVAPAHGVAPQSATTPENKVSLPAPENPAAAIPARAVPERAPVPFAELPLSIQRDIPKLSILFHLYSRNPKDRLVGINDRMLREGDAVEPGLVLEQVTPDGMILSYQGYRFLRGTR